MMSGQQPHPDAGAGGDDQDDQDEEQGGDGGVEVIVEDLVLPSREVPD